jgi:transposase-like protein
MAVFSVPVEPAHDRGDAGRPRHLGDARDDPQWGLKFGREFADRIRRRAPRRGDKWHLDEVVISFAGKKHWLWRAVDQDGFVLHVLVRSRRDKEAAKRLFRKLLKKQGRTPRVLVTDKLKSYAAAKREIMPGSSTGSTRDSITGPKTPINRPDDESGS